MITVTSIKNIGNKKILVQWATLILFTVFVFFLFFVDSKVNAQSGCSQGASCNTGTASGAWFTCWGTCGQWPNQRNCTAPPVCCGNGGVFQCESNGGCHTDCAGAPPQPNPPVCESLLLTGNIASNANLTTNPNIRANWTISGGSPSNQKFSWGREGSDFPFKDPLSGDWGGVVAQPKNINLARDGSITQGWYEVKMDLRNADGETQCIDRILYDNPPQILEVKPDPQNEFPAVSGRFGRWSGTETDRDNGKLNPNPANPPGVGDDHNSIKFGIKVYDPDGINDVRAINFGIGPIKGQMAEDPDPNSSCASDRLETVFMNQGLGVTINLDNGVYSSWNTICNASGTSGRFNIGSDVQIVRESNTTAWVYFRVTFGSQMMQSFLDVWAKAMDSQGVWSGPDGIDKYQKYGFWGVDTNPSTPGQFRQVQPLNAKSVRIWWDGEESVGSSGIARIYKGCKLGAIEEYGDDLLDGVCQNLRGNWSDVDISPTVNDAYVQYPNDVRGVNYRGETVNYIENIYINPGLTGEEDYGFMQWLTDGANNMVRINPINTNLGKSWLQIIQGEVFGNRMVNLTTPTDTLPANNPNGQGNYQLYNGLSTAMFNTSGSTFPTTFGPVMRTNKIVSGSRDGSSYNFQAGLNTIFSQPTNSTLFDRLKQVAIKNGKVVTLCGPASQDPPCLQDERDEKLNDKDWIDSDGVYLFDIASDTNILGIESNRWTNNSGRHNIILLVEGRQDSVKNFGIIPSLDPNLNIIILARNANVIFRTVGDQSIPRERQKENAFELDFLGMSQIYCNQAGVDCYDLSVAGKRNPIQWDNTYKDKDTYYQFDPTRTDDLGYNIVDPGLDVFGFFVISNNSVVIENEEEDYGGDLGRCIEQAAQTGGNCDIWDGDFERMEMRGGIVANRVEFKRNLVALDNSWIPSEKLIYGAQYIDAYVKAAKIVREQSMNFGEWEEIGLDY